MSESETGTVTAQGRGADPTVAFRDAIFGVSRLLAAQGAGPGHLTGLVVTAPDPGAVHPSRRAVDLAVREAFGGAQPPIRIRRTEDGAVAVEATFRVPTPPDPDTAARLREYSPRVQVADFGALCAEWTRRGNDFRRAHAALDLSYGASSAETLDLYRPAGVARPPVWIFVHGGYWQATTKEQHAQFSAGILAAGYAVANIEYALAPRAPLDELVAQARAAVRFLAREAEALDIDPDGLHIAGHSAGAHLAAMAALDPDGPRLRSALLLSGLFDLAPLAELPVGRLLGLDPATVSRLSPSGYPAPAETRIAVAVGGAESDAFLHQSRLIADTWGAPSPLVVKGANHFDLLEGLNGGPLLDFALATVVGGS